MWSLSWRYLWTHTIRFTDSRRESWGKCNYRIPFCPPTVLLQRVQPVQSNDQLNTLDICALLSFSGLFDYIHYSFCFPGMWQNSSLIFCTQTLLVGKCSKSSSWMRMIQPQVREFSLSYFSKNWQSFLEWQSWLKGKSFQMGIFTFWRMSFQNSGCDDGSSLGGYHAPGQSQRHEIRHQLLHQHRPGRPDWGPQSSSQERSQTHGNCGSHGPRCVLFIFYVLSLQPITLLQSCNYSLRLFSKG